MTSKSKGKSRCWGIAMNAVASGNMETVRAALHGITGVEKAEIVGPDRYLVVSRMSHELETVDSLRRHQFAAYWPNYEHLVATRQKGANGRYIRVRRRIGIIPGYVFSAVDPDRDFFGLLDRIVGALDIARTFSGNPLLVSDADIQILKRIEIGLNTPRPDKILHNFKRGQKVRFVDDLIGRWPPGVISALAKDGRISVEVDMMGRKVTITVLPHQIARM